MIDIYWPASASEWMAWSSAAVTVIFGVIAFVFPRYTFRFLRIRPTPDHPEAVGEGRATVAGFYLGLGLSCIVFHPQPLLYLALAAGWILTASGRLVSVVFDKGNVPYNWVALAIEIILAGLAGGYVFGWWV